MTETLGLQNIRGKLQNLKYLDPLATDVDQIIPSLASIKRAALLSCRRRVHLLAVNIRTLSFDISAAAESADGDEEEPDSSSPEVPPDSSSADLTISPMDSHLMALTCRDILRLIFERLPVPDLARASCVCHVWNSIASDPDMLTRAFRAPWMLKEVISAPSSGSFWRDNSIGKFAISHRIVRGDTVASLAVKYSVHVMDIKRLNNMMSDHGIYSRERLLIPISKPDILINRTCYIELDHHAKREVAVLYLEGQPTIKSTSVLKRTTSEQGKRRLLDSLKRSMHVDDGTAQYYLSISEGDPRAAISEFSEDLRRERQAGLA